MKFHYILTRLSDYYDQLSHIVSMCIEKNSFVLTAGTMNLYALGDNCQNFYMLLDLKICDSFISNYPIDLKLRDSNQQGVWSL